MKILTFDSRGSRITAIRLMGAVWDANSFGVILKGSSFWSASGITSFENLCLFLSAGYIDQTQINQF